MDGLIANGGLVVSCTGNDDNPLYGPDFVRSMALAARDGGARAIRASGPDNVRAAKSAELPVIGLNKMVDQRFPVYITPDVETAAAIVQAGADIVCVDCTPRPRRGQPVAETVNRIRGELWVPVMAAVATLEEGIAAAEEMGADYVATTLSGYTSYTEPTPGPPDLKLVEDLARRLKVPVIAEGRYGTPDLARRALDAGAVAVIVGTMITDPSEITRTFISGMRRGGW